MLASRIGRIKPSASSTAAQRARELKAQGHDIISLTQGEPDFPTPEHVKEAAYEAMRRDDTRYTNVDGTIELKEAVCAKFRRENGLAYAPDEISVGTGGKQVIYNALMATLDPGDEVIVPAPYWVSYTDMTVLAEGVPVEVPCGPGHKFKLLPEDLERAITPRTRWLILNSPNNPSGATYTREELKALAAVLLRHPHVWVLADDIYEHIIYDGFEFATIAEVEPQLCERTLTVNGVSKAYSMTGWRIGYAGGPKALIGAMAVLQSQSTNNPSSISQAAAVSALTGPQEYVKGRTEIFRERRDAAVKILNTAPGISCSSPEGAFYVFASCAQIMGRRTPQGQALRTDEDFVLYVLDAEGVALVHGAAYGMSPYFRLSYGASLDEVKEGCRRIARACERLS